MDIKKTLEQFGLKGRRADVYLAALELGGASVIEIAQKANVKRTTTYEILLDLQKDGLVSQTVQRNRRMFIGEDPEKINKEIERKGAAFKEILPLLKSLHNVKGEKPKIRFYEGSVGLKELYEDTLRYSGELLALGSDDSVRMLGAEWVLDYIKRRVAKGIHCRAIAIKSKFLEDFFMSKDQEQFRSTKYIDARKYPFSVEINIYGHQKVFMLSAKDLMGVIIESAEIHSTLKSMFELIWDGQPEVNKA